MRLSKIYILCMLVFMLLLTGCKVRKPTYVLDEDRMEELLYDYHLAKAMGENLPAGESYKRALYMEYVFQKHGTTEQQFDTSMVWYTRHAEVLSKMYGRVSKKLKEEQEQVDRLIAIRDNKPKTSAQGDSIDVWLMERMIRLTGMPLSNKLTFEIPTDTNFHARDTLQWSVYYRFLDAQPDTAQAALMSMAVQYENDSIIGETKIVMSTGMERIRIQSDTLGAIKKVQGFIYYTAKRDSIMHLFADSISLLRYHSNDSLFSAKTDSLDAEKETPKVEPKKEKPVEDKPVIQPQTERTNPEEMRMRRERSRAQRDSIQAVRE